MVVTEGLFLNAVLSLVVLLIAGGLLILIAWRLWFGRFPSFRFSTRTNIIVAVVVSLLLGYVIYTDIALRASDRWLFEFVTRTEENMRRATPVIGVDGELESAQQVSHPDDLRP